jgi:hypothetical protein
MSVNYLPMQPGKPNAKAVLMTATANTDRTGATGTFTKIWTAGVDGGRIDRIDFMARAATTAGRILIFESTDAGATKLLIGEIVVAVAATVDATNSPWFDTFYFNGSVPRHFNANAEIYIAPTKAESFTARVEGGDL